MAADWFLARHGRETLGPISAQLLKQMGAAGEVQATDLVWRPGLTKWTPAGQIKGLLTGSGEMPSAPPGPVGAQEVDWRTAGPPREAALPAAEEEGPAFRPEEEAPHLEREPWYYGFLERYTKYVLGLGGVVCVLGFVWFAVAVVRAAPQAGGAGVAVLAVLFGVLVLIPILLGLASLAALIRLLVDAARNLRELRRRGDRY